MLKEGMCVIIKKSQPVSVILSMKEYEKLKKKPEGFHAVKVKKKITLEDLRKNTRFDKFVGCLDEFPEFKGKTSRQILKEVWKDVD